MPDIEQLLHRSGLGYGQSLKDSLPKLDRCLAFLPGMRVLDVDRGPGRVKKLDLLLDKVTVDFESGAELSWDVAVAARRLRVEARDGSFFARLRRDRQGLVKLAVQEPGEVVAMYLRDIGRAASVRELQVQPRRDRFSPLAYSLFRTGKTGAPTNGMLICPP